MITIDEVRKVLRDIGVIYKDCEVVIDTSNVSHNSVITLTKNKNYIILRFSADWVLMELSYMFIGVSNFVSNTKDPLKMKATIGIWNTYLTNIDKLITKL